MRINIILMLIVLSINITACASGDGSPSTVSITPPLTETPSLGEGPNTTPSATPSPLASPTPVNCPVDMQPLGDGSGCIDRSFHGGYAHTINFLTYTGAEQGCAWEGRDVCSADKMHTACEGGLLDPTAVNAWSKVPNGSIRTVGGISQLIELAHCTLTPTEVGPSHTAPYQMPNHIWYCCK